MTMKVGASYYPEVIPEDQWEQDLSTGREIGLSSLRCGEFAWAALAPSPGEWKTDWAIRFLELARKLSYDVIWCTPTATPPPYLFDRWRDLQTVTVDGRRPPVGVRRNYCPSHAGYLDLAEQTALKLANDFKNSPAVVGWQIDNEMAGDGFTCWCPTCNAAFQKWLEKRYVSLENLNKIWQTNVWAQRYTAWSQIPTPAAPAHSHAPALRLAYRRFLSDAWKNFYKRQADALRKGGAKTVTTNFFDYSWDMPFDLWDWRGDLDAVGISHYEENETQSRFTLAITRSLGLPGKPLWVLEQKAGQQAVQNLFPEDLSRLKSHLQRCKEAGATHAIYWHLRQHAAGCEMEHGAVLPHDGKPRRVARAVQQAIREVENVKTSDFSKDVVLLFSYQQQWANEKRPSQSTKWDYRKRVEQDWYGGARDVFGELTIGCITDSRTTTKILLVPLMQMEEPGLLDAIDKCLHAGGTVITTADFCRLDAENNVQRKAPLAAIARWTGNVPEIDILHMKDETTIAGSIGGGTFAGSIFWAVFEDPSSMPGDVKTIGKLQHADTSGPFALAFNVGSGKLVVVLTEPDKAGVVQLLKNI